MDDGWFDLIDQFAVALCNTVDCLHTGSLAQALSVAALGFLHTGELLGAIWCMALSVGIIAAMMRSIRLAIGEAKKTMTDSSAAKLTKKAQKVSHPKTRKTTRATDRRHRPKRK